jgi:hypothetical protein
MARPSSVQRSIPEEFRGFKLKVDPTLQPSARAVVDKQGKRVAVIRKVGTSFTGSWDNYKKKYISPQAALRKIAFTKELTQQ